jgi:OOP family OmpA-OmpF porin
MGRRRPALSRGAMALMVAGGLMVSAGAGLAGQWAGGWLVAPLAAQVQRVLAAQGLRGLHAEFVEAHGWYTRHPTLLGGEGLSEATRKRVGLVVSHVAGVGHVGWQASGLQRQPEAAAEPDPLLACQSEVNAMLAARSIRFAENSAHIDPASRGLLDEVARALAPCAGSVIAITGHTDGKGEEEANLALSKARAEAVRNALGARGIDMAGLRARGVGSAHPLAGLGEDDPANRRIEFSLLQPVSPAPTLVDTPSPKLEKPPVAQVLPLWLELSLLSALTYAALGSIALRWAQRRQVLARRRKKLNEDE